MGIVLIWNGTFIGPVAYGIINTFRPFGSGLKPDEVLVVNKEYGTGFGANYELSWANFNDLA